MALNHSGTKMEKNRSAKSQNDSENFLQTTTILRNMERHKEIMRDNIARQKRQASVQRELSDKEAVLKKRTLQRLKEEKRENYEKFLRAQNSHQKNIKNDINCDTKNSFSGKASFELTRIRSKKEPDLSFETSEEQQLKNFEHLEKQICSTSLTKDHDDVQVNRILNQCISSNQNFPSLEFHQNFKPPLFSFNEHNFSKEEISFPAQLSYETTRPKNSTGLSSHLQHHPQTAPSKLKRKIYEHIDRGRNINLSESALNEKETEIINSLKQLNEQAKRLSKPKETAAMISPKEPENVLRSLEDVEILAAPTSAEEAPLKEKLPAFNGEAASKTLSAILDAQSISLMSDFPLLIKKDKGRYYRPPAEQSPGPELQFKNSQMQEKLEDGYKFQFNSKLLKELISK